MKKILSLLLVALLLVSAMPVAYAATGCQCGELPCDICGGCPNPDCTASNLCTCETVDTNDYSQGTQVSYTADSEANREYTITVPASMEPGQSGTVTLKGKWASNETVKVTADANVVLTNSINAADQKTLAITFAGIEKAGDNVEEKTYTETVAVAAMPTDALFGTWSGKFNYNVDFIEEETATLISFTISSTEYQAVEGMTWEQWVDSEYNAPDSDGYKFTISYGGIVHPFDNEPIALDKNGDEYANPDDLIIAGYTYHC